MLCQLKAQVTLHSYEEFGKHEVTIAFFGFL